MKLTEDEETLIEQIITKTVDDIVENRLISISEDNHVNIGKLVLTILGLAVSHLVRIYLAKRSSRKTKQTKED